MSLETALDDERREVMNILEGRPSQPRAFAHRSSSPLAHNGRTRSPAPPVRSMLDIAGPASPKPAPGASPTPGSTSQAVRSMLDPSGPGPARTTQSIITSSSAAPPSVSVPHRVRADTTEFRPRATHDREAVDLNTDYQFSMLPTIQNQALPKRVTQGGRKSNMSSMASIMQGQELGPLPRGRDRGRHNSTAGIGASSKSPSSRLLQRSESPGTGTLMQTPGKFITDSGKVIDMNNAYRRLSDAALLKSGGELSTLPSTTSSRIRLASGETLSPTGEVRLQKDYYPHEGDEEDAVETSDDELQTGSSADEAWGQGGRRGRNRGRRRKGVEEGDSNGDNSDGDLGSIGEGSVGMGRAAGPKKVKSLLAAAEEERKPMTRCEIKGILG